MRRGGIVCVIAGVLFRAVAKLMCARRGCDCPCASAGRKATDADGNLFLTAQGVELIKLYEGNSGDQLQELFDTEGVSLLSRPRCRKFPLAPCDVARLSCSSAIPCNDASMSCVE